jgi:D-alanyl-D-alanine carboxypeptidase (penicillin-binding protein 5/6)
MAPIASADRGRRPAGAGRAAGFAGVLAFLCCFVLVWSGRPAAAIETSAARALVIETDSGSQLFAKGASESFPPGNFAKLLTAAVVRGAIEAGEIRPQTLYKVSEHAWRTGGAPARVTTMFAAVRSEIPVEMLLRGLVVHYANDAAIILAEGLAGSEEAFAARMNDFADDIGMQDSRFVNPTGYPDRRARVSLADLRVLVDTIRTRWPDLYALYAVPEFEWNRINQRNKTRYLTEIAGAEGLVMAYEEAAGYSAAVSVRRDGRRVLVLASGFGGEKERDAGMKSLVDAAYADFTRVTLFDSGSTVGNVRIFGGAASRVAVTGDGPITITLPKGERDAFRLAVVYDGPVPAPVTRGQAIASLEVRNGDDVYQRVPLVAVDDVPVGDMRRRAQDGLMELLFGWW